jgi:hypothetical protein
MREMERKLKWNFCFFWVEAEEEDINWRRRRRERCGREKKTI